MAKSEKKEIFMSLLNYGTLGLEMGVSLVIGLGMGYCLDRYVFHTSPILTIVFMIFGILAGMKRLYMVWKKMEQDNEGNDRE
jgi:ATP synthase protein I